MSYILLKDLSGCFSWRHKCYKMTHVFTNFCKFHVESSYLLSHINLVVCSQTPSSDETIELIHSYWVDLSFLIQIKRLYFNNETANFLLDRFISIVVYRAWLCQRLTKNVVVGWLLFNAKRRHTSTELARISFGTTYYLYTDRIFKQEYILLIFSWLDSPI